MEQSSKERQECLYDFLYLDKSRINSWYSQLAEDGMLLTSLKYAKSYSETAGEHTSIGPRALASVQQHGSDTSNDGRESNHSPEWAVPIAVIEQLEDLNLIKSDISSSHIGSIVRATGRGKIADIRLLQRMWQPALELNNLGQKVTAQNKKLLLAEKQQQQTTGKLLDVMPSAPQLYLQDSLTGENVWAYLRDENFTINPDSIGMTYGSKMTGELVVVGTVDALPDDAYSDAEALNSFDSVPDFTGSDGQFSMDKLLDPLADAIRLLVGRRPSAYAINPLAIYRTISFGK